MAQIDFLTEPPAVPVVQGNPDLHEILVLDRGKIAKLTPGRQLRENLNFLQGIRQRKYDIVFDFFGNPRSAIITRTSCAKLRVGYNWRGRKYAYNHIVESRADRVHEAEFHLDALRSLEIPVESDKLYFPLDSGSPDFVRNFMIRENLEDKFLAGINCSGGWSAKRWPLAKFAALADRIIEELEAEILLFWGPGEQPYARKISQMMKRKSILAPPTSLTQMGALLKQCRFIVSNDSGPMHIAAALEVPTVGIFGPTNSRLQGPYGKIHEVAEKTSLECLACNRTSCDHNSCMETLSVDEVWDAVIRCIEKNRLLSVSTQN